MMASYEQRLFFRLQGPPLDILGPPISREAALEELKRTTGVDFGYDLGAWKRWLDEHGLYFRVGPSTEIGTSEPEHPP